MMHNQNHISLPDEPQTQSYWLGPLKLANPLVIASSPATEDIVRLRRCAAAGAGAAILKSCHTLSWTPFGDTAVGRRFQRTPRGLWGTSTIARELLAPNDACSLLSAAGKSFPMPVIPSIAGRTLDPLPWVETLRLFEPLRPACVQIDLFYLEDDISLPDSQRRLTSLMHALRDASPLPLLPKLNQELRPGAAIEALGDAGICGWSILDSLRYAVPPVAARGGTFPGFSRPSCLPTASLFGPAQLPATIDYLARLQRGSSFPIMAGGGVSGATDCLLLLSMGASAIQVATPVLEHGEAWISQVVAEMEAASCCMEDATRLEVGSSRFFVCRTRCRGCGSCVRQMMCVAVDMKTDGAHIVSERCEGCGFCAEICPEKAIMAEAFTRA